MPAILPIISTALSLGTSIWSQQTEAEQLKKAKRNRVEALEDILITEGEEEAKLDRVSDVFNTQTANLMNRTAFTSRNAGNSGAFKGAVVGGALAKKGEALLETEQSIDESNRSILGAIAGVESTPTPSFDPARALNAGIQGLTLGVEIEDYYTMLDKYDEYLKAMKSAEGVGSSDPEDINLGRKLFKPFTPPKLSLFK